ncbi:hypothetical protein CPC08DRAFT_672793 [Agrocybe pediades]|nr:hypothetical protein CPC08DRAFT_672793 [Agrocybe pediades]
MSLRFRPQVVDACVTLICVSLSAVLYVSRTSSGKAPTHAYVLHNQVTHARLLPRDATHAFTYPTLALLLSLDDLEKHRLDLGGGWIFGYGGLWGRITGLRSKPYLTIQPGSIRWKLDSVLCSRGYPAPPEVWMMTMPSFLGCEGINPLTVYFCYDANGCFWLTVLEVHNTFGESHVYVLEVGKDEDSYPSRGYDHQWTFRREFHVSPFNDRSGFYKISVKRPTHSPSQIADLYEAPRPSVRVHLYTASEDNTIGQLKLTALLRPSKSTPLTTSSLLWAILKAPSALLLTMPRILYVAWILHYKKHLDVYLRPEPLPASHTKPTPGGVKWLEETLLERFARQRVVSFLQKRAVQIGMKIVLAPADPIMPRTIFAPDRISSSAELTISYLSPRFFTILFLAPSAEHALLLGSDTEHLFDASSRESFLRVFSRIGDKTSGGCWLQHLRASGISEQITIPIAPNHFLDDNEACLSGIIILIHRFLDGLEKWVFTITRARIVKGQEPWKQWERASNVFRTRT